MRNIGGTRNAGRIVQVVKVRNAFRTDILISTPLAPYTEIPAGHALTSLHKCSILALGAPFGRAAMAVGELHRTLSADIVVRVVLIGLALRALLVVSTETTPRDDLRAELADMVLVHTVSFLAGITFPGRLAGEAVLYDGAGRAVVVIVNVEARATGTTLVLRVAVQAFGNEEVADFTTTRMREVVGHALLAIILIQTVFTLG
jgi:hypothetical protein